MSLYLGDFAPGKTVVIPFNTHQAAGTPITLAGTPAVAVYKGSSTAESTSGVTLTVDFDGRTGSHLIAVDTSSDETFYAAASEFRVVLTAGTVDGISVVGIAVGAFSLANRTAYIIGFDPALGIDPETMPTEDDLANAVVDAFGVRGTVDDGSPSASGFDGDSSLSSSDDFYIGAVLTFKGGTLDGIARKITGYTGATKTFTFASPFPSAPADTDPFTILGLIEG